MDQRNQRAGAARISARHTRGTGRREIADHHACQHMMTVIIVDDEAAGRRTLREYCEAETDLRVVGEFGDGATALAAIRLQPPHLLFLDIQMDPPNGIELARSLGPSQP